MGLRKEIKEIKSSVNELKLNLAPSIIDKARKYDELIENLSKIKIKVKSAKKVINDSGDKELKVEYEIDPILLSFDEKGNAKYEPMFYALNITNLISYEDMEKLMKAIRMINF